MQTVVVCGHICSGKTSIIEHLSQKYSWDIISFGNYVRYQSLIRGLPSSRETYQTLGQKIFTECGPHKLVEDVINFTHPTSSTHLYDGVRHLSVLNALKEIYFRTFTIYLKVSPTKRFFRYKARSNEGDFLISYKEFLQLSKKPIERGISKIEDIANKVIDASRPFEKVIEDINYILLINEVIDF